MTASPGLNFEILRSSTPYASCSQTSPPSTSANPVWTAVTSMYSGEFCSKPYPSHKEMPGLCRPCLRSSTMSWTSSAGCQCNPHCNLSARLKLDSADQTSSSSSRKAQFPGICSGFSSRSGKMWRQRKKRPMKAWLSPLIRGIMPTSRWESAFSLCRKLAMLIPHKVLRLEMPLLSVGRYIVSPCHLHKKDPRVRRRCLLPFSRRNVELRFTLAGLAASVEIADKAARGRTERGSRR